MCLTDQLIFLAAGLGVLGSIGYFIVRVSSRQNKISNDKTDTAPQDVIEDPTI